MNSVDITALIDRPGGYQLSDGVIATRDGIVFTPFDVYLWHGVTHKAVSYDCDGQGAALWVWPDAAKRLIAKKGYPSIALDDTEYGYEWRISAQGMFSFSSNEVAHLARIALALIERETDAEEHEAFLVLHWCVTELGV